MVVVHQIPQTENKPGWILLTQLSRCKEMVVWQIEKCLSKLEEHGEWTFSVRIAMEFWSEKQMVSESQFSINIIFCFELPKSLFANFWGLTVQKYHKSLTRKLIIEKISLKLHNLTYLMDRVDIYMGKILFFWFLIRTSTIDGQYNQTYLNIAQVCQKVFGLQFLQIKSR